MISVQNCTGELDILGVLRVLVSSCWQVTWCLCAPRGGWQHAGRVGILPLRWLIPAHLGTGAGTGEGYV